MGHIYESVDGLTISRSGLSRFSSFSDSHKKRHWRRLQCYIALLVPFGCSRADDCKKKMSALQTFLLVVDHNKEEAKQIAERVAQGECSAVHELLRAN